MHAECQGHEQWYRWALEKAYLVMNEIIGLRDFVRGILVGELFLICQWQYYKKNRVQCSPQYNPPSIFCKMLPLFVCMSIQFLFSFRGQVSSYIYAQLKTHCEFDCLDLPNAYKMIGVPDYWSVINDHSNWSLSLGIIWCQFLQTSSTLHTFCLELSSDE